MDYSASHKIPPPKKNELDGLYLQSSTEALAPIHDKFHNTE